METYGKWNEDVKKVLVADCVANGYEPNDQNLIDTLTETEEIFTAEVGKHRWWNDQLRVIKIGEYYIGYIWGDTTGDHSLSDLGWVFELESAQFYEPKEVVQVTYVLKESKE